MKHWQETAAILRRVSRLAEAGRRAALATVVRIEGSAYRRPGAKFLVEDDGRTTGGVSGGCLEADVREVALRMLRGAGQEPTLLRYDTGSDDRNPWGLGLGCRGVVEVFVQPATREDALAACRAVEALLGGDEPFAVSTVLDGPHGGRILLHAAGEGAPAGGGALERDLAAVAGDLLARRESRLHEVSAVRVFTEVHLPPPHLVLFGAGDDAVPLARAGASAGFRLTVVDARPAWITEERFPGARLVRARPEDGAGPLPLGADAYAVVMSHSLATDREWLRHLLASRVRYIGLLGPRARTRELLEQLGAAPDERVYGPVGLDLGADGPDQVALSVVAELLAVRAGREPRHLRERKAPIHLADRAGRIAAVVLAAGASTRMGTNKLLLPLEGETVLRRAVRRASAAGLDPVVVVLGHEADRTLAELAGLPCRPVVNPDWARGMNASIRAGVAAVPPDAVAAVVALADMPFVTEQMLAALAERYRSGTAPLVVSEYGGVLAPPMLYDRSLFPELGAMDGDGCGKRVVKRHRDEAVTVTWPKEALGDLDHPADYQRVRAELGAE